MSLKQILKPRTSIIILTIILYIIAQIYFNMGFCQEIAILPCENSQEFIYSVPPILSSNCQKYSTLDNYLIDRFLIWILPLVIAYIISAIIINALSKIKKR